MASIHDKWRFVDGEHHAAASTYVDTNKPLVRVGMFSWPPFMYVRMYVHAWVRILEQGPEAQCLGSATLRVSMMQYNPPCNAAGIKKQARALVYVHPACLYIRTHMRQPDTKP